MTARVSGLDKLPAPILAAHEVGQYPKPLYHELSLHPQV